MLATRKVPRQVRRATELELRKHLAACQQCAVYYTQHAFEPCPTGAALADAAAAANQTGKR